MPRFSDINFRYTDAEEEKLYSPELIEKAYVDADQIIEKIDWPNIFLIIGPKGSGKTALSSKLSLMESSNWDLFVETDILEQFEYQLLKKTGGQKGVSIGGALTAWQLILFLRIMQLFLKDEKFKDKNEIINKFSTSLRNYGLTESSSLINIIQYTSRRGVFSKIKSIISELNGERIEEEKYTIKDPSALLGAIKEIFSQINPADSKYYLFLDGLDYILREGRNNAIYIADLINAVRELNIFFVKINIKAKIIILIRNEVLKIIPDPNLTKRINDNGIFLRWYDNTRDPLKTELLRIIEKRANLAGYSKSIHDLWNEWFPQYIHNSLSYRFILNNTRYLPRDIISFFRELQKIRKDPPFKENDILAALNNYSDWFLSELKDAVVGLFAEQLRNKLPSILFDLGKNFQFIELEKAIKKHCPSDENSVAKIAEELFNTAWIGNVWKDSRSGTYRYNWIFRKYNASFKRNKSIIVHPGLYKSLNLL